MTASRYPGNRAMTREDVGTQVLKILNRTKGPGMITRDQIMARMGSPVPPKTKHSKPDGGSMWIRQAITRFMTQYCEDPECPWEKTAFVASPSWKRKIP